MDADTKKSLGGALAGALVLLVGLVLRFSGSSDSGTSVVQAIGAAMLVGGGLVLVICLAQVAVRLMRA